VRLRGSTSREKGVTALASSSCLPVDGHDSLVERLHEGAQQLVFHFERVHAATQLLGHALDSGRQLSDFAGGRDRRPLGQVARGDCAGDVAQLDDWRRDLTREHGGEGQRDGERHETRDQDVASRARDDRVQLHCADRNSGDAPPSRAHRDVHLFVTLGRTHPARRTQPFRTCLNDLRAVVVILEHRQRRSVELAVAEDLPAGVHQRHAMAERLSGRIGEGVEIHVGAPLLRDETRLARELRRGQLLQLRAQPLAAERDRHDRQDCHDQDGAQQKPLRQLHATITGR
jgi:hypothetical protein